MVWNIDFWKKIITDHKPITKSLIFWRPDCLSMQISCTFFQNGDQFHSTNVHQNFDSSLWSEYLPGKLNIIQIGANIFKLHRQDGGQLDLSKSTCFFLLSITYFAKTTYFLLVYWKILIRKLWTCNQMFRWWVY